MIHSKTTGNNEIDSAIEKILDTAGTKANRDQLVEAFVGLVTLAKDDAERLNLKITNAVIQELADAYRVFKPYSGRRKVAVFGSARTAAVDPLYEQARQTAQTLSNMGWMVVTGAGPGIMAAGLEGAGKDNAFGINIQLPFEQGANEFIAADPKLVTMKYFFTRKLMLIKESDGFVIMPGGFGTMDECFELLTLVQTGKAEPTPIVMLDTPTGSYWAKWLELVEKLRHDGWISVNDDDLFKIANSPLEAAEYINRFYKNYQSRRFVGKDVIIRLKFKPEDNEIDQLNEEFGSICADGKIETSEPTSAEVRDNDELDLFRLRFPFDKHDHAGFMRLIHRLNELPSTSL